MAFATLKNRVAAKGWLDMRTDSLDINMSVLDSEGCSVFDQRIHGDSRDPEFAKVKVFKTLLAPVTNVAKGVVGAKCKVVYNGIVAHPEKKVKQKE